MQRVLVVDDDRDIRELIGEVLRDEGYQVFAAADGQAAVALARANRPDLILMDLRMPILDGVSAIRLLKDDPVTSNIRVVAMSAGTVLRAEVQRLPVDGLLDKPFDLDLLLALVTLQLRHPPESTPI